MGKLSRWIDARFYPQQADNWDDELLRQEILELLRPDSRVLDLGAGAGRLRQMDFSGRAARVCGIDLDAAVLDNPHLDEARVAPAEEIPYDDGTFDLVFANNVLEHLRDPLSVFRAVSRVLAPGGTFLFKTPNRGHYVPLVARWTPHRFHLWFNRLRGRAEADTFPTLYRANSRRQIGRLAAASGLVVRDLGIYEGRPEYLRFSAASYLLGLAYERLVNSSSLFERFRVLIVGRLEKPASPRGAGTFCALTAHPLSRDYRSRLEDAIEAVPAYRTLAELRQLSLLAMLRELRRMKPDTLLLPFEDPTAGAILSLLSGLGALTRARRLAVVDEDLRLSPIGRIRALASLAGCGWASLTGLLVALGCRLQLRRLNARPRQAMAWRGGEVLYLKSNLARGVKAGGSVGHIAGIVNGLARRGRRVRLFSADRPPMIDPQVEHEPVALPRAFGLPRDVNQYLFHRLFCRQTRRRAAAADVGFIYQRLSVGSYAGVELSRQLGAPLVIEYNGSEVWVAENWGYPLRFPGLARAAENACLRHAHLVVTVSRVLRDELLERGVDPERIVAYPNCIDPLLFDPARFSAADRRRLRALYDLPEDALVVTFIGTFGQWHGVEVFARSIAQLVADHREWLDRHRLRFLLIGDGLKRPEVEEILSPDSCAPYFRMPGLVPQDQAPLHLAASDILVSPHVRNADGSRFFGSPTKLFEYLAMGRAIVASDLDQIGEVLAGCPRAARLAGDPRLPDRCAALLTEPGDARELAEAIRLLAEHPSWRRELGRRGRELALARYTWDHHVGAILDGIERVSPAPGPRR